MASQNLEAKLIELRRTLAWMDLVLENINEAILVVDSEWRVIFANTSLSELLGQGRIVLLGQLFGEILPVGDQAGGQDIESISLFDGIFDLKINNVSRKMLLTSKYVPGLNQAVCVIDDVSIEIKAEGALKAMHQRVARLQEELDKQKDKTPDANVTMDRDQA